MKISDLENRLNVRIEEIKNLGIASKIRYICKTLILHQFGSPSRIPIGISEKDGIPTYDCEFVDLTLSYAEATYEDIENRTKHLVTTLAYVSYSGRGQVYLERSAVELYRTGPWEKELDELFKIAKQKELANEDKTRQIEEKEKRKLLTKLSNLGCGVNEELIE